nr:MAG TPA: hypothetical protein [Caudoviricetes sp.]
MLRLCPTLTSTHKRSCRTIEENLVLTKTFLNDRFFGVTD